MSNALPRVWSLPGSDYKLFITCFIDQNRQVELNHLDYQCSLALIGFVYKGELFENVTYNFQKLGGSMAGVKGVPLMSS